MLVTLGNIGIYRFSLDLEDKAARRRVFRIELDSAAVLIKMTTHL
jgi:hypothetical protein